MSELIYRILDIEKVKNTIEKALIKCNELKDSSLSESDINIELNSINYQLCNELETCIKTE